MANYSNFLSLTLPGAGEYRDAWWEPTNRNFSAIDKWAMAIDQEIVDARFSMGSLAEFLAVGHEDTGSLKATDEAKAARNSPVFGYNSTTLEISELKPRLDNTDWEIWRAREGQLDLRAAHAFRSLGLKTLVISGSKNTSGPDGYPDWLTLQGSAPAGPDAVISGLTTNLWLLIDGKLGRVRTNKTLNFAGQVDGTYYIYAQFLEDDDVRKAIVDGDGASKDPVEPGLGMVSGDANNQYIYFNDLTRDFVLEGVKPGDILKVTDTDDAGLYIIKQVTTGLNSQLEIYGSFPVPAGLSGVSYLIIDPLSVDLGFEATEDSSDLTKIYIGEVTLASGSSSYKTRHFGDTFIGQWQPINVAEGSGITQIDFYHGLNSEYLDISVQACSTIGGYIEELGMTSITYSGFDLALNLASLEAVKSGTVGYSVAPSLTPGYLTPSAPQALTNPVLNPGGISDTISVAIAGQDEATGSLTGDLWTNNAVKVKWDKNNIYVKNAVAGKFFKNFEDSVITSGYIRVIVRRRG